MSIYLGCLGATARRRVFVFDDAIVQVRVSSLENVSDQLGAAPSLTAMLVGSAVTAILRSAGRHKNKQFDPKAMSPQELATLRADNWIIDTADIRRVALDRRKGLGARTIRFTTDDGVHTLDFRAGQIAPDDEALRLLRGAVGDRVYSPLNLPTQIPATSDGPAPPMAARVAFRWKTNKLYLFWPAAALLLYVSGYQPSIGPTIGVVGGPILVWYLIRIFRMSVRADGTGLCIRNPLRTYHLPWARLESVGSGQTSVTQGSSYRTFAVRLTDGKVILCGCTMDQVEGPDVQALIAVAAGHGVPFRLESTPEESRAQDSIR
jgi:Bacterial PH domain